MLKAEKKIENSLVNSEPRTIAILLCASVLQEPLSSLILLLPILMIKEVYANAIHISALTALAPAVSILSFYLCARLNPKSSSKTIKKNLVLATCLTALVFLLFPLESNPWFFVFASTCYTLFFRAANPARMELLKRNISAHKREKVYSWIFKVSYSIGMLLGPALGSILDSQPSLWKCLFVCASLCYLLSALLYHVLPIDFTIEEEAVSKRDWHQVILDPWKRSYEILCKNSIFARFQIGFFIAGFGLMLAKPAGDWLLGNLDISYYSLFLCRTFLKGLGVIGTAHIWVRRLNHSTILKLSSFVAWGFLCYNLLLMGGFISVSYIFLAYLVYGVAQSGSHLMWNLSGTLLSGEEPSHQYSTVNILAVGVRGCIAPVLGGMVLSIFGVIPALIIGGMIMFIGAQYLARYAPEYSYPS